MATVSSKRAFEGPAAAAVVSASKRADAAQATLRAKFRPGTHIRARVPLRET
jgi:hypothetical protein